MIIQVLGWAACIAVLLSTCAGVYSIHREAVQRQLDEQRDRYLKGHEALVEYVVTLPGDEDPRELIAGLSADVIRYTEIGREAVWLAAVLDNLEVEDQLVEELNRKWSES